MLRTVDARTGKQQSNEHHVEPVTEEARALAETITVKRDRLLASLTLIAGIGLIVALPFALQAGAEFFMPVTAALVVAVALVPLLEWFERQGRALAALRGPMRDHFPRRRDLRDRLDRRSGRPTGSPSCRTGSARSARRSSRSSTCIKNLDRFIDAHRLADPGQPGACANGADRGLPIRSRASSPRRRRTC